MLVRQDGETLKALLKRLNIAWSYGFLADEVNWHGRHVGT
jgi:hypothetical protein